MEMGTNDVKSIFRQQLYWRTSGHYSKHVKNQIEVLLLENLRFIKKKKKATRFRRKIKQTGR
jgi:3-phosphoglycerate kinase